MRAVGTLESLFAHLYRASYLEDVIVTNRVNNWDERYFHGWKNRYPFTEVVSFVMQNFGGSQDRGETTILDLGCGSAHHLKFLAQEGFQFYGVDGSSKAIEIAKEMMESEGFESSSLSVATFDDLPYEDDFFDGMIDRGALVCNPRESISEILVEVRRVLKPGGKFISFILNEESTGRTGAKHIGNNDYVEHTGRLKDAGLLHYTNAEESAELFSMFNIDNILLQITKSEYKPSNDNEVMSWQIITCSKPTHHYRHENYENESPSRA